jgi:CHRD domain
MQIAEARSLRENGSQNDPSHTGCYGPRAARASYRRDLTTDGFSMNKLRAFAITIFFFAAFASFALAETTAFTADLRGSFGVPPVDSRAKGRAELTYDDSTKKLKWTITYWGLTGKTTSAHFHGPAKEGKTRAL